MGYCSSLNNFGRHESTIHTPYKSQEFVLEVSSLLYFVLYAPCMHRTTISIIENIYCHRSFQKLLLNSVYGACMVNCTVYVWCILTILYGANCLLCNNNFYVYFVLVSIPIILINIYHRQSIKPFF